MVSSNEDQRKILFRKKGSQVAGLFSFDAMKPYAEKFYKSQAWKKTQIAYTASVGGLCERCYQKGLMVPGEIVHHKTHITPNNIDDPNITLNWDNLIYLCRECHYAVHHRNDRRYTVDSSGRISTT